MRQQVWFKWPVPWPTSICGAPTVGTAGALRSGARARSREPAQLEQLTTALISLAVCPKCKLDGPKRSAPFLKRYER